MYPRQDIILAEALVYDDEIIYRFCQKLFLIRDSNEQMKMVFKQTISKSVKITIHFLAVFAQEIPEILLIIKNCSFVDTTIVYMVVSHR
jgi:hypothetical protein